MTRVARLASLVWVAGLAVAALVHLGGRGGRGGPVAGGDSGSLELELRAVRDGRKVAPVGELEAYLAQARADWRSRPLAAIEAAQSAAALAEAAGDRSRHGIALRLLAKGLAKSGAADEAVEPLERALVVERSRGAREEEITTLLLLARVYMATQRGGRAERLFAEAGAYYRARGDRVGLARVGALEADRAGRVGDHERAIALGSEVVEALEGRAQEGEMALIAASALAYALHQSRRWEEARLAYDRVVSLAWSLNDQSSLSFAYCNRAEVSWCLGARKPAMEDLERAIEGIEVDRAVLRSAPLSQLSFIASQGLAYDRLIRYLADSYRGTEAFEVAERYHARRLLEGLEPLAEPAAELAAELAVDGGPERQAQRRKTLVAAIGRARLALEQAEGRQRRDQLRARLNALEEERRRAEREFSRGREAAERPRSLLPPSLAEVRAGLEPGEVLVNYWLSEERLFAWSVSRQHVDFAQVPVSRAQVTAAVAAYLEPLANGERAQDAALARREQAHLELGQRLYRWLIVALPSDLRQARRLIVVPDGVLHYLPFEALIRDCSRPAADSVEPSQEVVHGRYRDCHFLGLDQSVIYSPSAGSYLALRRRQRQTAEEGGARGSLLALAPSFEANEAHMAAVVALGGVLRGPALGPLRFSRREVESIAELFPESRTWVGEAASEERLKREASAFRYIHLATHGLVRDDLPMSSGVLLRPGVEDDGLLQAHEVLDLNLRADLVTLSACRTGRGSLRRGEGIVGLSRAFLYAGASSVLVSLWDVDDQSTPLLMEAFYRGLARGLDRATALRDARRELFDQSGTTQLVFRRRPLAYAHPRYWASFVLIGTP